MIESTKEDNTSIHCTRTRVTWVGWRKRSFSNANERSKRGESCAVRTVGIYHIMYFVMAKTGKDTR